MASSRWNAPSSLTSLKMILLLDSKELKWRLCTWYGVGSALKG